MRTNGSTIEGFSQKGPIITTDNSIIIHTTDLPTGITIDGNRIEILYYNNITRSGELLSSIVYMSDVTTAQHGRIIEYIPTKLHNNSIYEKNRFVEGHGYRWANADIIDVGSHFLTTDATTQYPKIDIVEDLSVIRKNKSIMFDGWYSIVSVFPGEYSDYSDVIVGDLRSENNTIVYATTDLGTAWADITNINAAVPIANLARRRTDYADYCSLDFLVLDRVNKLYADTLRKTLNKEWFSGASPLAAKLRSLESLAQREKFLDAQYIINSINTNATAN